MRRIRRGAVVRRSEFHFSIRRGDNILLVVVDERVARDIHRRRESLFAAPLKEFLRLLTLSLAEERLPRDRLTPAVENSLAKKPWIFTFRRRTWVKSAERIRRIQSRLYKEDAILEFLE